MDTMSSLFNYDPALYNQNSAREILPWLFNIRTFKSVVDVGCGIGTWLSVAHELGVVDYFGLEMSEFEDSKFEIPIQNYRQSDLRNPIELNRKFDICLCLEVGEHLPPEYADQLISTLCNLAPVILFSAAIPGQPGQDHINMQWPEYWQAKFEDYGFDAYDIVRPVFWHNSNVAWWYRQNMIVYAKPGFFADYQSLHERLKPLVHPDLYHIKIETIQELQKIKEQAVFYPSFGFAIRSIAKSILVTPFKSK